VRLNLAAVLYAFRRKRMNMVLAGTGTLRRRAAMRRNPASLWADKRRLIDTLPVFPGCQRLMSADFSLGFAPGEVRAGLPKTPPASVRASTALAAA
jgi:hypothetical protein